MSWSERLKLTFSVFKKTALPLYLWYIIFLFICIILAIVIFLLPPSRMVLEFLERIEQNNLSPAYNGFTPTAYSSESSFSMFNNPDFLQYWPAILQTIVLFCILVFVATALFYSGTYHLAVKGLQGKARFKDIKISGFARILCWYLLLSIGYFFIFLVGFGLLIMLSRASETASAVYSFIALAILIVGTLFILPWMLSAVYYIIAHAEQSFTKAFGNSWRFFRKNMGALWGGVAALFLLNIGIGLVNEVSSTLGGIVSFLAAPLMTLVPVIWTVTLMQEKEYFALFSTPAHFPASAYYPPPDDSWTEQEPQPEFPEHPAGQEDEFTPSDLTSTVFPSPEKASGPDNYSESWNRYERKDVDYRSQTPPTGEDSEFNFCSTCGSILRPNSIYCSKCGVKVR